MTVAQQSLDPIVTEIIRNGLIATTEEMKTNLMRSAYSMIIYEVQDFTVGLFDADGETISIGIGLPMFVRGMSDTVKAMLAHFGRDAILPGDVFVTNDAYLTGSHLNHITLATPVFSGSELLGFSACMAHWADIGGALDGMTKDIYSEGLQVPILKLYRADAPNQDVLDILRMNVRIPERAMGDLNAQVAAVRLGAVRMLEIATRHGNEVLVRSVRAIMDQTEALTRKRIAEIPNGVYEAESFMDDDGVTAGERIPIKVRVTVAEAEMTIDLTDVGLQVRGFYNSGEAAGKACCQVAFKCLTSPLEKPINEGSFRALKIILPPGRVVSAQRPAPMRWWMTFPMTVVDTIFKALAPAIPELVIAGHHADLMSAAINGKHRESGKLFLLSGGFVGGGWGARYGGDGVSTTIAINDGDTHNTPVEQVEAKFPMLVERYALRQDSGGAGTWQGGLGAEKIVRALGEFMFNAQVERVHCRPWGLFGGLPGAGNQVAIRQGDQPEARFPSGKVLARLLAPGDAYILRSGGGGGYGSPLERDLPAVEHDYQQGYISAALVVDVYGAVFKADGASIDYEVSRERRAALKAAGWAPPLEEDDRSANASATEDRPFYLAPGILPQRCC